MACGTRVAPNLALGNGAVATAAPTVPAPPPGTKQAYALSFSPLGDERLRYRVARWVVDRAPGMLLVEGSAPAISLVPRDTRIRANA
jgi:hypothetical protein